VARPKPKKVTAAQPALTVVKSELPAGQKFCKRHDTTHPFEAFAKDKSSKTGYYSICKVAETEDRAAKKLAMAATVQPTPARVATPKASGKKAKGAAKK
jgi:hypothetical protein